MPRIVGYAAAAPTRDSHEVRVLAFIDEIVIPFLNNLYGAVGYLGVMLAMAIESAMIPLPSELILPYAGFLVSDPSQIEPLTGQPWNFWIVVVVATIGNTLGSLIAYAIGAYGGRPFLERYGKYLLIRPHEIELADSFFARHGAATVFIGRLLPIVRTFISFPAGVARMPISDVHRLLDRGRLHLVVPAGLRGHRPRRELGARSAHALQPFDLLIAVGRGRRGRCCSSGGGSGCRAGRGRDARDDRRPPDGAPQPRRSSGGRTFRNSRYISRS